MCNVTTLSISIINILGKILKLEECLNIWLFSNLKGFLRVDTHVLDILPNSLVLLL